MAWQQTSEEEDDEDEDEDEDDDDPSTLSNRLSVLSSSCASDDSGRGLSTAKKQVPRSV